MRLISFSLYWKMSLTFLISGDSQNLFRDRNGKSRRRKLCYSCRERRLFSVLSDKHKMMKLHQICATEGWEYFAWSDFHYTRTLTHNTEDTVCFFLPHIPFFLFFSFLQFASLCTVCAAPPHLQTTSKYNPFTPVEVNT